MSGLIPPRVEESRERERERGGVMKLLGDLELILFGNGEVVAAGLRHQQRRGIHVACGGW